MFPVLLVICVIILMVSLLCSLPWCLTFLENLRSAINHFQLVQLEAFYKMNT